MPYPAPQPAAGKAATQIKAKPHVLRRRVMKDPPCGVGLRTVVRRPPRRRNVAPVGDVQAAVAVQVTDITGPEPPLAERGPRGRLVLVVAAHHVRAAREDLAVLSDTYLDTGDRWPHGARFLAARAVQADDGRGLG